MSETTTGVVLQNTGGQYDVRLTDGRMIVAALRGRLKREGGLKVTVGDDVQMALDDATGAWTIAAILPRRSRLARRSPGNAYGERIVVANVDQVMVVLAMVSPLPKAKMLDRFLIIAESNQVPARVVINKLDLASRADAEREFGGYEALGYPVHYTSTHTGEGLEALHDAMRGRVTALTGPSGVGKSSLLNALYPGLDLRVAEISESVNKGRHTTVGARMHPLPDGGFVVDTPGLREVGLWGIAARDLERCFPEFAPAFEACRFADCRHLSEPECAVRSALDAGAIAQSRYESYVKLREEVEESDRAW